MLVLCIIVVFLTTEVESIELTKTVAVKQGTCPPQIGTRTYGSCTTDDQCSGTKKCCPPTFGVCYKKVLGQCPSKILSPELSTNCSTSDSCFSPRVCCTVEHNQGVCIEPDITSGALVQGKGLCIQVLENGYSTSASVSKTNYRVDVKPNPFIGTRSTVRLIQMDCSTGL